MRTLRFCRPFLALSLLAAWGMMSWAGATPLIGAFPPGPPAVFWELDGNSGTDASTNFLGTIDGQPLVIKTNGSEAMRVGVDGAVMASQVGELSSGAGLALSSDLRFNGKLRIPASYIIYTDGTTVYALNGATGKVDFQGTDAAAVIRSTIAPERHIVITAGTYVVTSPLELVSDLTLEMESGAILEVPNGYDGYVFGLGSGPRSEAFGVHNTHIAGGTIREERTDPYNPPPNPVYPQRKWLAILLHVEEDLGGVYMNTVQDVEIHDPDTAIRLLNQAPCDEECWIIGNEFIGLRIHQPRVFIEFSVDGVPEEQAYFDQNYFEDILGQCGPNTEFGVKDVRDPGNVFVGVKFWDMKRPGAVSTSLHWSAKDTIILGGLMTQPNLQNEGHRTQIIDRSLNKQLTLDELVIGTASVTTGYYLRAEDDGLHIREHHTPGDALRIDPDGTLMTDEISELSPGAGIAVGSDLLFGSQYRLFVGADGLYLEDLETHQVYRLLLEEVDAGE
jgi:hypothetical protein